MEHSFVIPMPSTDEIQFSLKDGQVLFVLGANGTGKSALMQQFYTTHEKQAKRILAHRQTWFTSNAVDMTAAQKKQNEEWIHDYDKEVTSRWQDNYSSNRLNMSIFELLNSENMRAREITSAVDQANIEQAQILAQKKSPIQTINEIFEISNIPIKVVLEKDEQLFASKNKSDFYSIAELSDGERNALLICADVLTAASNTIIIIDEPERHLHRSIISPLLLSLFQKREDCAFIISTHDVYLPINNENSQILLIRNCTWNENRIESWDADLIINPEQIPTSIKLNILGAKRKILFVEGEGNSLDKQIYQLIFPDVTVIPQGNCRNVERAVNGINRTKELHWLKAIGLVDADDRTSEDIQALLNQRIAALECYSVESLYYNTEIIKKIAYRYATVIGNDGEELYNKSIAEIIKNITPHKERLCSRLCERRIRNLIMSNFPSHKQIEKGDPFTLEIEISKLMKEEEIIFDKLIAEKNLNGLIARYPVRETPVLSGIAVGMGLTREKYESAVRQLIIDDHEIIVLYKSLLKSLTHLIEKSEY